MTVKTVSSALVLALLITLSSGAASPYKSSQWKLDWGLLAGSALLRAVEISLEDNLRPLTIDEIDALDRSKINWFDRSAAYNYSVSAADISTPLLLVSLLTPAALLTADEIKNDALSLGVMYFEVFLITNSITDLTKNLVKRARPYVYNTDVSLTGSSKWDSADKTGKDARKSFFSSHVANAFSMAVFTSAVYRDYFPESKYKKYIWGGTLGLASMVGYLRYEAGLHYPTDILSGALVGSAVGWLIPAIHRMDGKIEIVPNIGRLSICYSF